MHVDQVTIIVEHAFGEHARFKGRRAEAFISMFPQGLEAVVVLKEGMGLSDLVAVLADQQIVACELAIKAATDRENASADPRASVPATHGQQPIQEQSF
jgi:hypothetical protein